jgi:hypothetical protein
LKPLNVEKEILRALQKVKQVLRRKRAKIKLIFYINLDKISSSLAGKKRNCSQKLGSLQPSKASQATF